MIKTILKMLPFICLVSMFICIFNYDFSKNKKNKILEILIYIFGISGIIFTIFNIKTGLINFIK